MSLLDLIFPKTCLECGAQGKYICQKCLLKVGKGNIIVTQNNYAFFKYEGVVRKAIIKLKYNFSTDLANELVESCYKQSSQLVNIKNAVIIPVPLSSRREKWRGFNQASLLSQKLASKYDWLYEGNLLYRLKNSTPQAQLDRKKRLRNIRGKFAVNPDLVENNTNKNIIIFDDVITTGSTIEECKNELKKAGFKKVYGLSVCG